MDNTISIGGKIVIDSEGNKTTYNGDVRYNKTTKQVEYIDENGKWQNANTIGGNWFSSADPRSTELKKDISRLTCTGMGPWIKAMKKKLI